LIIALRDGHVKFTDRWRAHAIASRATSRLMSTGAIALAITCQIGTAYACQK
jgi:O-acetyl-ADP-ribose deacetylase (regulator of RNase III)